MYYIYKIENEINHKKYIGLTNNIVRRRGRHFGDLRRNKHDNSFLQKEFNIYEYRVREHDTGWRDYDMVGYGIRPIITIKAGVQIASGQGTKTDSYILK